MKLNPKMSYCLLEPFDVFFLLSVSVQCPPQIWGFALPFYSSSLILPSISVIVSSFLQQALSAHLRSQTGVWAPFAAPTYTVFLSCFWSFVWWFQRVWSPSCLVGNSWAKEGAIVDKGHGGKEQALGPIFWVENIGEEKQKVENIEKTKGEIVIIETEKNGCMKRCVGEWGRKMFQAQAVKTLTKNRWFYCMNLKGINYPV